jgi:glycerol uptake facilitator-like aquaporin
MSEQARRIGLAVVALLFAIIAVTHGGHGVEVNSAIASGCSLLSAVMPW